ncbi:hypothetical protein Pse7367_1581 [Thalassoporum mexicanum PCC 7367]|uniref:hypothetical protein n=1 Tax=Thalassoporum mexicanum TaxID=3457544 RepID=UPI00029FD715|nr:hypothetical protein [Pseudanabaena sp. PCC 7367]AFY69870.1 hypothetical protein Pse7367_1581 [Pseudanabaena sp. PCC 7367]
MHTIRLLLEPVLIPFCAVMAWTLTGLVVWNAIASCTAGLKRVKQLRQIPCANCQFFTNDYRLKCTVRPTDALTDHAVNCRDFMAHDFRSISVQ